MTANITSFKLSFLISFVYFLSSLYLLLATFAFAQETYNLEIIFKRTVWDSYPNLYDYGISLAGGDVNADGYSDVAVGASHWIDSLSQWAIDVYIFFGSAVMDTFYDVVLHCPPHSGHNASALWIGDINGDGIGDVAVGDLGAGDVRLYFGSVLFDTIVDFVIHNVGVFGCSVAGGDINGDGFNDLVVGSYINGGNLNGRVYVYYGGPLLDTIPDVVINGHNGESMGITVGSGGDVNSDGYEDIVAGAFNNNEAGTWAGKVYVFLGGNPMDTVPDCWLHGEDAGHSLGLYNVSFANNISDFDGTITGTWHYQESGRSGKIYILYGGSPMDTLPDIWMIGPTDTSGLGYWSATVKKTDGDTYAEVLGGAPGMHNKGTSYLWLGALAMDTTADAWLYGGNSGYTNIGNRVANAGDVNGDGYDEVMFSNYAADSNQTVWVCRYAPEEITETGRQGDRETKRQLQVYPNPFKNELSIKFEIRNPKSETNSKTQNSKSQTTIKIYDATGRLVKGFSRLTVNGERSTVVWDATDDLGRKVRSGVYFVRVEGGGVSGMKKVVKVR